MKQKHYKGSFKQLCICILPLPLFSQYTNAKKKTLTQVVGHRKSEQKVKAKKVALLSSSRGSAIVNEFKWPQAESLLIATTFSNLVVLYADLDLKKLQITQKRKKTKTKKQPTNNNQLEKYKLVLLLQVGQTLPSETCCTEMKGRQAAVFGPSPQYYSCLNASRSYGDHT